MHGGGSTAERVYIYDTTLRDGAQTESVSFSLEDKSEIAGRLDGFGMDFIEGGMPSANPKDAEFFELARNAEWRRRLVAFGSTRRPLTAAADDPGLAALARCSADWVCIFGKAWTFHVTEALGTTPEENLEMVADSVSFLRRAGKRVVFDAEHYFDGSASDPGYAEAVASAAAENGAEWVVLCDTNGGTLPSEVRRATERAASGVGAPLGIHCHNDCETAVACSLAAVDGGARMVQGTVNGIGERCGNANLCSLIPDLKIKAGYSLPMDLSQLRALSAFVAETANLRRPAQLPYVGDWAFAHKGGMHVSALRRDPRTYEHVPPESVGNRRRILVSDMSGQASVSEKLRELGIDAGGSERRIAEAVKDMEAAGYQFEGADASLRLLVSRLVDGRRRPFDVAGFRLFIDQSGDGRFTSEASVRVADANGNVEHTAADGDGPVNALDRALRKALSRFYPVLAGIKLTDYKVRVLDEKKATASPVRVLIRSTDGEESWSTVGVSENVIEASLIALSDSIEYAIMKHGGTGERQ